MLRPRQIGVPRGEPQPQVDAITSRVAPGRWTEVDAPI